MNILNGENSTGKPDVKTGLNNRAKVMLVSLLFTASLVLLPNITSANKGPINTPVPISIDKYDKSCSPNWPIGGISGNENDVIKNNVCWGGKSGKYIYTNEQGSKPTLNNDGTEYPLGYETTDTTLPGTQISYKLSCEPKKPIDPEYCTYTITTSKEYIPQITKVTKSVPRLQYTCSQNTSLFSFNENPITGCVITSEIKPEGTNYTFLFREDGLISVEATEVIEGVIQTNIYPVEKRPWGYLWKVDSQVFCQPSDMSKTITRFPNTFDSTSNSITYVGGGILVALLGGVLVKLGIEGVAGAKFIKSKFTK